MLFLSFMLSFTYCFFPLLHVSPVGRMGENGLDGNGMLQKFTTFDKNCNMSTIFTQIDTAPILMLPPI